MQLTKVQKRKKIHRRIRKSIIGSATRPRLCVFRSNKSTYAQLIDDANGKTIMAASTSELKVAGTKIEQAKALGLELGKKAKTQNLDSIVFDRNGYLYHGRVKAIADGLREGGLKF